MTLPSTPSTHSCTVCFGICIAEHCSSYFLWVPPTRKTRWLYQDFRVRQLLLFSAMYTTSIEPVSFKWERVSGLPSPSMCPLNPGTQKFLCSSWYVALLLRLVPYARHWTANMYNVTFGLLSSPVHIWVKPCMSCTWLIPSDCGEGAPWCCKEYTQRPKLVRTVYWWSPNNIQSG